MKIRNGFVSNSSSSSFIVGIGELPENFEVPEFDGYNVMVKTGKELVEEIKEATRYTNIKIAGNAIEVEGGGNSDPSVSISGFSEDKKYIIVNINNDEGDDSFWNDFIEDLNYDIDLDWFSEEQKKVYNLVNSLENSDIIYGAERNG